jgi:hypothetical protein
MIMNETMYMPFMVLVILGTALLSAVVTTALPHVPKWWDAFKSRIKRKSTPKSSDMDMVDVILISKLTERVDDLQEQVDNLIEVKYNRDRNRKNNIRRDVREYLKELQK